MTGGDAVALSIDVLYNTALKVPSFSYTPHWRNHTLPEDRGRILVADDDASIRSLLRDFLEDEGFEVCVALNGEQVLEGIRDNGPDLVLMDVRMPKLDGIGVLNDLKRAGNAVPVIVMTAYGSSNITIKAIQLGAYDYIAKPFDLDDVSGMIDRFFEREMRSGELENVRGRAEPPDPTDRIIGNGPAMQAVYKNIGRVAGSDATVLITGETGTGKELVAHTLHTNSTFSRGPLVKVNCAALPETLLESELFGHEKGSFTGALNQRKGRFELADKGTIFLDEIGEMTLGTQKKLLRVLQEREFERVGGVSTVKVDTRVVAATNKVLEEEVNEGLFREDLFYRLSVIHINLPPLRERKEDIPELSDYFLGKHRYRNDGPPASISQDAVQLLMEHDWPGNVRELENTVERAVILAQGGVVTTHHLVFSQVRSGRTLDLADVLENTSSLDDAMREIEGRLLVEAVAKAGGDRDEAAAGLALSPSDLEARLEAAQRSVVPGRLT
ncbi:MAG: sigma-54-dependent Fis family transcriptional regulator [Chloroflexia bacterium]|nr:sigma-54-dependent Fis family transcriptional regulator [Chloroflexia bacterium]